MSAQIIDGKRIAHRVLDSVRDSVAGLARKPKIALFIVGDHPAIEQFVSIKKRRAAEVGIEVEEVRFPADVRTKDVTKTIVQTATRPEITGIIVQLPLPELMDVDHVLGHIPMHLDIDVLAEDTFAAYKKGTTTLVPPVAAAVHEVLRTVQIDVTDKKAVILGAGRLVGAPVAALFDTLDVAYSVIDRPSITVSGALLDADIVVSGIGVPHFVQPGMLKPGAVLIDCGTSSDSGVIKGDIDPGCAEDATLFTPTPGGIGPITVACLLRNAALATSSL
jgi:methylenetetrahydrofolate dehydrogenase (NADP+)/methenyltetrahydrofolate cyclohydrolase